MKKAIIMVQNVTQFSMYYAKMEVNICMVFYSIHTTMLILYETEHVFAAIQLDGSFRRFIGVVMLIILLKKP
jgi:hypothetical protein